MKRRTGFLEVVAPDEARARWDTVVPAEPLAAETVPIAEALGRVLASDVDAPEDVPAFRRADRDGFAVRARDTFGATEEDPRTLRLHGEPLTPGRAPDGEHPPGGATPVATGAVVPRGADAVVMIEDVREVDDDVVVLTPVVPGEHVTQAGTDVARGEAVGRHGDRLSARDTAVLAACGVAKVAVVRRPRVAVLSTGDEVVPPGAPFREGLVRDCNARSIADAVREVGGEPVECGVVPDDPVRLAEALRAACVDVDLVLLSGGTSKGAGDLAGAVLGNLEDARVLVHGVALRPGKPLLLGALGAVPFAVLPGFPTSALFTFHAFVAPVLRRLGGLPPEDHGDTLEAVLPVRIRSRRGFEETTLVDLVRGRDGLIAWPIGRGSGSITTFARADGFTVIGADCDQVEAGETVQVVPFSGLFHEEALSVVGSHCAGVDLLARRLRDRHGLRAKVIAVGSLAGLDAARRGACDVAGIHLLDEATDTYNAPFLGADAGVELVRGYRRRQGFVFRADDPRFAGRTAAAAAAVAVADERFLLAQRNRGSGTRILIDRLFDGRSAALRGGDAELRSHTAVCAAIRHGKADGGVAEETVARAAGLGFAFLREECFDFVIPTDRLERPAVRAFRALLADAAVRRDLTARGFVAEETA